MYFSLSRESLTRFLGFFLTLFDTSCLGKGPADVFKFIVGYPVLYRNVFKNLEGILCSRDILKIYPAQDRFLSNFLDRF